MIMKNQKPQSDWKKIIGEMKIATFGSKERLKDFPDVMKAISVQIRQAQKQSITKIKTKKLTKVNYRFLRQYAEQEIKEWQKFLKLIKKCASQKQ